MSENEQVIDSSVQEQAPIIESNSVVESVAQGEGQQTAPVAEKMIPQSEVNRIAARESRQAAEKARNEMKAQYERQAAQAQSQQTSQPQNLGGMQQHSPDQLRQMIQEEAWKMSQHAMAQKIEQDWLSSMNAEKDNDPEFAQLYDALNIEAHPDLVLWANGLDNKVAVVKDIAKNPSKFSSILMLARSGSPELAKMELNKLSSSIKANEAASKQPQIDSPLSQIKPSNIGSDSSNMSVKDYMLIFRG